MEKKNSILVVEDNRESLTILCRILEKQGYSTTAAESGDLALAFLEKNLPDLIILDIQMPDISGFEVCEKIKSKKNLAEIPVVFVSAAQDISDKIKAFKLGAVDFIVKPYQVEELAVRIKTHLSLRKKELQLIEANKMLLESKQKVNESEEKYRAIYENNPLSFQSLNEDGSFLDVNETWLHTLGYNREEVIGKYYIDFLHPDWREGFEKKFLEFKRKGTATDVQFKIRQKDGHYLDISFNSRIGYHPDGSFKQTYCVFQDITERKQLELTLRKSENELRQHRDELEILIQQRTKKLEEKNKQLEEYNELFIGREFRIKELRDIINMYREKFGEIELNSQE